MTRLERCIESIDALNRDDPRSLEYRGKPEPREWFFSVRRTVWLGRLVMNPGEELQIAVRAQHLQRWKIPRETFPMNRIGYKEWRNVLAQLHAKTAAQIMTKCGYGKKEIQKTQRIIMKKNFKSDPEAQALEDCVCIVFLQWELDDFAARQKEDKILVILRKTWQKMSENARKIAQSLPFSLQSELLVKKALAGSTNN